MGYILPQVNAVVVAIIHTTGIMLVPEQEREQ
jgi:hypothetical protein